MPAGNQYNSGMNLVNNQLGINLQNQAHHGNSSQEHPQRKLTNILHHNGHGNSRLRDSGAYHMNNTATKNRGNVFRGNSEHGCTDVQDSISEVWTL